MAFNNRPGEDDAQAMQRQARENKAFQENAKRYQEDPDAWKPGETSTAWVHAISGLIMLVAIGAAVVGPIWALADGSGENAVFFLVFSLVLAFLAWFFWFFTKA